METEKESVNVASQVTAGGERREEEEEEEEAQGEREEGEGMEEEEEEEEDICPLCLSAHGDGLVAHPGSCSHYYHAACLSMTVRDNHAHVSFSPLPNLPQAPCHTKTHSQSCPCLPLSRPHAWVPVNCHRLTVRSHSPTRPLPSVLTSLCSRHCALEP